LYSIISAEQNHNIFVCLYYQRKIIKITTLRILPIEYQ